MPKLNSISIDGHDKLQWKMLGSAIRQVVAQEHTRAHTPHSPAALVIHEHLQMPKTEDRADKNRLNSDE